MRILGMTLAVETAPHRKAAQPQARAPTLSQHSGTYPGFGVPALAGGPFASSSALRVFKVIVLARAPPPEGGTPYPNIISLLAVTTGPQHSPKNVDVANKDSNPRFVGRGEG